MRVSLPAEPGLCSHRRRRALRPSPGERVCDEHQVDAGSSASRASPHPKHLAECVGQAVLPIAFGLLTHA